MRRPPGSAAILAAPERTKRRGSPRSQQAMISKQVARWGSLLGVVLVVAAFAMTAARAVELELNNRVPFWVVNAIPAAISELYYGHRKRYTALESVDRRFFNRVQRGEAATARTTNAAMRRLEETSDEDPGTAYVLMGPDDKGIVDLVEGSFLLFGLRLESIITFYFLLLALSCVVYMLAFWRSPAALFLLAAFLAMLYLIMPMVTYNPQLRSLLALRALAILSMVACLHGLSFMAMYVERGATLRSRGGMMQIGLLVVQAVLLAFTIHLRSTTLWQVATLVGFGAVLLAVTLLRAAVGRRHREPTAADGLATARRVDWAAVRASARSAGLPIAVAVGLALASVAGIRAYQALVLPVEYQRGDELATRNVWHNVFTGFAYHPGLRERFQLRLDDVSIEAATRDWLIETGRLDAWLEIGGRAPDPAGDAPSAFEGVKLAKYDPYVRDMTIARCSTFVRECLETELWYKPLSLANNLLWLYGFRAELPDLDVTVSRYFGDLLKQQLLGMAQGVDGRGQRAYFWTPRALLVLVPFAVLLVTDTRERTWAAIWAALALALGSTIPTVVGYAAPHTIGEPAIAFGMLVYLGLGVGLAGLVRVVFGFQPSDE